jgi:copper chaperone CopZ
MSKPEKEPRVSTPITPSQAPSTTPQLTYLVEGMSCHHCTVAVTDEVTKVAGVAAVDVDLDTKLVRIHGTAVDASAVVAAIDEAGYDAVAA